MLVVDFHPLAAVDTLDFVRQVLLHGFFARNAQNVVGHQRAVDQRLPGSNDVAGMDQEAFSVRHQVFAFDAGIAADDDSSLSASFFAQDFDHPVDFGDHRGILRLAGFENLGHARQTARDVRDPGCLAGRLRQHGTGRGLLALTDLDMSPFRQVVDVQRFAVAVFEHDLRVQFALVIDDHAAHGAAGVLFHPHRLAFDDILETHLAGHFGQNGDTVRVPLAKALTDFDFLVFFHQQFGAGRHVAFLQFTALGIENGNLAAARQHDALAFFVADEPHPSELDDAAAFGAGFAFLDAGIDRAADVKGPHRQLGPRLADTLRGDDADGHALFDHGATGQIHTVAAAANAERRFACQRAANLDFLQPQILDFAGDIERDHVVFADDHLVGDRIDDVLPADAAHDGFGQLDFDLLAPVDHALGDALGSPAFFGRDHHILGNVGQFTGEIARVGRLQRRIGQSFAGPVRRTEVFQHAQALAEIRLDRRFDDIARGLGHQSTHPGQLPDLLDAATGTGVGHQVHGVDVPRSAAVVRFHGLHHFGGDLFPGVGPRVEHLVVPLLFGDHAAVVQLLVLQHLFFRLGDVPDLRIRGDQVVGGEREAAERALLEPHGIHVVQQRDRGAAAQTLVAVGDDRGQFAGAEREIVEVHAGRQAHVVNHASDGGLDQFARFPRIVVGLDLAVGRQPDLDLRLQFDHAQRVGQIGLFHRGENHALAAAVGQHQGDEIAAHHNVLRGAHDRLAVGRAEDVVRGHHQRMRLDLRLDRQRQMDGHLVAVKVGVESFADQRMQVDGVAFDQHRLEGLNAHAVQRRRPVQHHGMILDHRFEDVPDLLVLAFEHLLGALDRVGVSQLLQLADDERLEQLQGDLFRQAALMQLQPRSDDDHAARRVIDAFSQQVLAKAALLALDHVRQRLQRPVAAAQHGALAAVVVEQGVDRLLQHPLLVADDHLGRVQIDQLAQTVVPVDDAAVQVVQIAGGKVARIQQHQRAQIRRNHGDDVQHHPLRLVVAVANRFDDLQPVDQVLPFLLRIRLHQLDAQLVGQLDQVQVHQQLANRLGTHVHLERPVAPLFAGRTVLVLGQQLLGLQVRAPRVDDGVVLEVDDLFQTGGLHVQQVPQPARHGLEEPDVDDGSRQLDVPHPLASDARVRDLDAATIADHPFVFHAAVLAAGAFPVLLRTENPFAEQAVLFGAVGAVVDRLRLLHFAERPTADVMRPSQADLDRRVIVNPVIRALADGHVPVLLSRMCADRTAAVIGVRCGVSPTAYSKPSPGSRWSTRRNWRACRLQAYFPP